MTCSNCGVVLQEGASFCHACGLAVGEGARITDGAHQKMFVAGQETYELAGFGVRVGGFVLDIIIYFLASLLIEPVFFRVGGGLESGAISLVWLMPLLLPTVANWVFFSLGQTPGQSVVGVRIVDRDGRAPGVGRGLGRAIVANVSWYAFGVGYLWAAWDGEKQTWHDKAAATHVVRTRR